MHSDSRTTRLPGIPSCPCLSSCGVGGSFHSLDENQANLALTKN